jgi:hypothetical protein
MSVSVGNKAVKTNLNIPRLLEIFNWIKPYSTQLINTI